MAGGKRTCSTCGNGFIGRSDASYCSPACRKRAQRARSAGKCDAPAVTVTAASIADVPDEKNRCSPSGHSAEAVALLSSLDSELAENSAALGLLEDAPLVWSAAEEAVRESIARTVDRNVDLWHRYLASDDDKTRVKLSAELRLLETSLARLLKSVKTDLPVAPSIRSAKAAKAANARWSRAAP
jgi:hypothetical protein